MVSPLNVPQQKTQFTAVNRMKRANDRRKQAVQRQQVKKPVTSCSHVDEGAIWCNDCAAQFLTYARKTHAKALAESSTSAVVNASVNMLKRALSEYRLTSEGVASLERSYADYVAQGRSHDAANTAQQIAEVKRLISERNHDAREIKRKRKVNSLNARSFAVYKAVPKTVDGRISTANMAMTRTHHARERQILRNISDESIQEAFVNPADFTSHSRGKWAITGHNQVVLLGVYSEDTEKNQSFRVITVYWSSTPESEVQEEIRSL